MIEGSYLVERFVIELDARVLCRITMRCTRRRGGTYMDLTHAEVRDDNIQRDVDVAISPPLLGGEELYGCVVQIG